MGRHASDDQGPFYRSLIAWLLPWALITAVIGAAVVVALDAVERDEPALQADRIPPSIRASTPGGSPSPPATTTPTATTTRAAPTSSAPGERTRERRSNRPEIGAGLSVQLLDGSGHPAAHERMRRRLTRLGYDIVAEGPAGGQYDQTIVYWSSSATRNDARRLAARFGWIAQPKSDNLQTPADIHVVLGRDVD